MESVPCAYLPVKINELYCTCVNGVKNLFRGNVRLCTTFSITPVVRPLFTEIHSPNLTTNMIQETRLFEISLNLLVSRLSEVLRVKDNILIESW